MRLKLKELARINATARKISQEVEKRFSDQDIFEKYMADQLQKDGLLTKAEYNHLELIRGIRNRSAHPSGVHAKPEDARCVYRWVIDYFLSQPLIRTTHAADALLARLTKSNVFPGNDFEEMVEIAKAELAEVSPAAHPYLVDKLVAARSDPAMETNALGMLAALAATDNPSIHALIRKYLLEDQSHDPVYGHWIAYVTAANGAILKGLKSAVVPRVRTLLTAHVQKPLTGGDRYLSHPATQLAAMISCLGEDAILKDYQPFADAVLRRHPYAISIIETLGDASTLRAKLVEIWLKNAKSSTFDIANKFAAAALQIDDYAEKLLTDDDALRLIIGVVEAANWKARRAQSLRSEQFAGIPKIREMALRYAKTNVERSTELIEKALPGKTLDDFLADELGAD